MELYTTRGGTREDLETKKFNIGIGLSLGNKWFTPEHIIEQMQWALPHTKEYIVVYVADTIHAINLEVRSHMTRERALRVATRYGKELLDAVQAKADKVFTKDECERIFYATWDTVETLTYKEKVAYLYDLYTSNQDFFKQVQNVVLAWTAKDTRRFSPEELKKLGTYILEELPELVAQVFIGGRLCEAYTYPFDGDLVRWVEKIQQGKSFPEIKQRLLDTEPKVFLEVR